MGWRPDMPPRDGHAVNSDGTQEWYRNGQLHREDGPARVWLNGTWEWWRNDLLHREDGPAIIRPDGTQAWWRNGILVPALQEIRWVSAALRGLRGHPEAVFAILAAGLNKRRLAVKLF